MLLPGESQGRESLVGCHLWGRTESDMRKRLSLAHDYTGLERFLFENKIDLCEMQGFLFN